MRYASLPPAQPRAARRSVEIFRGFFRLSCPRGCCRRRLPRPLAQKPPGAAAKKGFSSRCPPPVPPKKPLPAFLPGRGGAEQGGNRPAWAFPAFRPAPGPFCPGFSPAVFLQEGALRPPQKGPSPRSRKLLSLQGAFPLARGAFLPSRLSVPFLHGLFAGPSFEGGSAAPPASAWAGALTRPSRAVNLA